MPPFRFPYVLVSAYDDPELHRRFERIVRQHRLGHYVVDYDAWVLRASPEGQCVFCGRPARYLCVITVERIAVPSAASELVPLTGRRGKRIVAEAKEELQHHRYLCLFPDCARPLRAARQELSPA